MQLYTIFPPKNINVDFSFNLKGNNKDRIFISHLQGFYCFQKNFLKFHRIN